MQGKQPFFNQSAEMVLQCVAAGAGGADHVGHCDATVLADVIEDLNGKFGSGRNVVCGLLPV